MDNIYPASIANLWLDSCLDIWLSVKNINRKCRYSICHFKWRM